MRKLLFDEQGIYLDEYTVFSKKLIFKNFLKQMAHWEDDTGAKTRYGYLGETHSKQREQQIQRPWPRSNVFRTTKSQCGNIRAEW